MTRALRTAAAALACAAAACGPRPVGTAPGSSPPPVAQSAAPPKADSISAVERARVGTLRVLAARGVAELRWREGDDDHFEQGDADLRWCLGRGAAVSVSKLGERLAWFGSDGTRWWQFALRSDPSTLRWGTLAPAEPAVRPVPDEAMGPPSPGDGPDLGAAVPGSEDSSAAWRDLAAALSSPRLLGLQPLVARAGAVTELRDGLVWMDAEPAGRAAMKAAFDPATLRLREVVATAPGGAFVRTRFEDEMSVETVGAAPGAWPRIARRIRVETGGVPGEAGGSLLVSIDSARADPEAADRPFLYDLGALTERFKPAQVSEAK